MRTIDLIRSLFNKTPKANEIQQAMNKVLELEECYDTALEVNDEEEIHRLEMRLPHRLNNLQEMILKYTELGYNTVDMQIKHDQIQSWLVVAENRRNYESSVSENTTFNQGARC